MFLFLVLADICLAKRQVLVTISTTSETSPPFTCKQDALDFQPLGASASLHRTGDSCVLRGASMVGEYVIGDNVIKAIDLRSPVRNLGGSMIFQTTWQQNSFLDSDAFADSWRVVQGCDKNNIINHAGKLTLHDGCGVVGRPHEARTLNFFRAPLTLSVSNISTTTGTTARFAFEVPTDAEMIDTGWPHVRHYLPLVPVAETGTAKGPTAASSLAALIECGGNATLVRQRTRAGQTRVLGTQVLPGGCGCHDSNAGDHPAQVKLFAGSVLTHKDRYGKAPPLRALLTVDCGSGDSFGAAVKISSDLGLDFHDQDGFGESVGEAVLGLGAVATGSDRSIDSAVVLGAVSVINELPSLSAPAVLAPITDQLGTINWDHGALGSLHSTENPPFGPESGVLDVTKPPFNADNSGATDATLQLQAAIDFSRHNYLALWLPAGQYLVTDSLNMTQRPRMASLGFAQFNSSSNYCWSRFTTWAMRGQTDTPDANLTYDKFPRAGRATLIVPPHSPAFALHRGAHTAPKPVLHCSTVNARGHLQPNILMSMIVQSIDVVVGAGNPAAVGVRMRGAQGSSLEDVAVFAAADTFAGVSGCSGSGGAHSNVTVVGARYGWDARDTQPAPTLSNIRLFNQTCTAMLHLGIGPLTIAGMHVVTGPMAQAGVAAIVSELSLSRNLTILEAFVPTGNCAPLLPTLVDGQLPKPVVEASLSVIDSVFVCAGCNGTGRAAVSATRSLYMRRVAVEGFETSALTLTCAGPPTLLLEPCGANNTPASERQQWKWLNRTDTADSNRRLMSVHTGLCVDALPTNRMKMVLRACAPASMDRLLWTYNASSSHYRSKATAQCLAPHHSPGSVCHRCLDAGSGVDSWDCKAAGDPVPEHQQWSALGKEGTIRQLSSGKCLSVSTSSNLGVDAVCSVSESLPGKTSASGGTYVEELSFAVAFLSINATQWIDGHPASTYPAAVVNARALTPADTNADAILSAHSWGDNAAFPGHAKAGALNAKHAKYGAVGDGVHDDTAALQAVVKAAAISPGDSFVFLPRGVYKTSATILVPRGVRVVGLARHLTTIVSSDISFAPHPDESLFAHAQRDGSADEPAYDSTPILSFANQRRSAMHATGKSLETTLVGLTLVVPTFNKNTNVSMVSFRAGAAVGNFNSFRQMWTTRIPMCGQWWSQACADRFYHHPPFRDAYVRVEGEAAALRIFVFFQEDGQRNNGEASQSPFSRKLLVRNTRQRVVVYQLNGEHGHSTAYSEFRNTSNVEVFGSKSEQDGAAIFVRDSNNFSSYGHGGPAQVNGNRPLDPRNCDNLSPCPWGPGLYRISNSSNVRLLNMASNGIFKDNNMVFELRFDNVAFVINSISHLNRMFKALTRILHDYGNDLNTIIQRKVETNPQILTSFANRPDGSNASTTKGDFPSLWFSAIHP